MPHIVLGLKRVNFEARLHDLQNRLVFCAFVGEQTRTPTRSAKCRHRMMSSLANYRPFLRSFRHIPLQDSFVKLAN